MSVDPALAATISASGEDQELWEVIVAPDDIKLLTLEQLDDAFRLDVIGVSTLVRQQGTSAWQRLGVVAGIESEATGLKLDDAVPALARPKPGRNEAPSFAAAAHPFWNAGALAEPVIPLLDPAVLAQPVREEPLLEPPTFDSLTRAEPQRLPAPAPLQSYRAPQIYPAAQGSSAGFVVVVVAAILGIVCVAHRNDLLRLGARSIGLESKYLAFEKKLGGAPGFGTPRSLEAFLGELGDSPSPHPSAESGAAAAPKATTAATSAAPSKAAAASRPASGDGTKAVSLDALPVLAPAGAKPETAAAPAARAAVLDRADAPSAPKAAPAPAPAKAQAEKIQLDETPARPKKPENPLNAAIRAAMEKQNKK